MLDCEQSLLFLLSSSSRGNLGKENFSLPRFPCAGVRDVFPRLDELKRKNRDCS